MRYIFVGDRDVGVWALQDLIDAGHKPLALGVAEGAGASHARELCELSGLSEEMILSGRTLSSEAGKKFCSGVTLIG